jgi:sugar lactone lactonase YvrE
LDKIPGKNTRPYPRARDAAAVVAALLLSACGGGGGGAPAGGGSPLPAPVTQAPAITSQPVAQTVTAGQSATVTVKASGDTLSYQWQRDGKDIAGATSDTYTLAAAQASDNGAAFTVIVKNAGGSVTSSQATLSVTAAAPPAQGLSVLAGTLGGPGNVDGIGGRLAYPLRIAMSPSGLLYVADNTGTLAWDGYRPAVSGNLALRTVNVATGDIGTVKAAPLASTVAVAFDKSGNLYESDGAAVYRTAPGGQRSLFAGSATEIEEVDAAGGAARFTQIRALVADENGNVYVGESSFLRKISPQGVVTTVAGGAGADAAGNPRDGVGSNASFSGIAALAIDANGNLQVLDNSRVRVVTPAGAVTSRTLKGDATIAASYAGNDGIAVDQAGNLYVTYTQAGCRILKVAPDGQVTTLAGQSDHRGGNDGAGTAATFCKDTSTDPLASPNGRMSNLTLDAAGNLYVADTDNVTIRRIAPDGTVSTVAGHAPSVANVDGAGAGAQFVVSTYDPRAGTHPFAAAAAYDLAADAQGNFYVRENDRIRRITTAGNVTTLAPQTTGLADARLYLGGLAFGGSPAVVSQRAVSRVNADGSLTFLAGGGSQTPIGDGTGAQASFYSISALVGDAPGNLYLLDAVPGGVGSGDIGYVRKITPAGAVTTLPAGQRLPGLAAADGSNWYVSYLGEVTKVQADGTSTVVRQLSATAGARVVAGALDRAGNLYVAWHETPNWYAVHKVTPAGIDTIVAGTPGQYGVRLGAPGSLGPVDAMTLGADGYVYVMSENAVLRIVQ